MYHNGYCLNIIAEKVGENALGIWVKMERLGNRFENGTSVKEQNLNNKCRKKI